MATRRIYNAVVLLVCICSSQAVSVAARQIDSAAIEKAIYEDVKLPDGTVLKNPYKKEKQAILNATYYEPGAVPGSAKAVRPAANLSAIAAPAIKNIWPVMGGGAASGEPLFGAPVSKPAAAAPKAEAPQQKGFLEGLWDGFVAGAKEVGARVMDVGRTVGNMVKGVIGSGLDTIKDVAVGMVKDLGAAVGKLFKGDIAGAAKGVGGAVKNAGTRAVGGVVDSLALAAQGAFDIFDTMTGKPLPRDLTAQERSQLSSVYGDSVDLSDVKIREGSSIKMLFENPHSMLNTIYTYPPDPEANRTLVHETAHIWQAQNGGNDFIHESLFATGFGKSYDAYEWTPQVGNTAFQDLNCEQQARVVQDYIAGSPQTDTRSLTPQERAYAAQALKLVQAGQGAER